MRSTVRPSNGFNDVIFRRLPCFPVACDLRKMSFYPVLSTSGATIDLSNVHYLQLAYLILSTRSELG